MKAKKIISLVLSVIMLFSMAPASHLSGLSVRSEAANDSTQDIIEFGGHSYQYFENTGFTWNQAKEYCENIGGHLAVITSQEEQSFIEQFISEGSSYSYWLGACYDEISLSFKRINDEVWDYDHWCSGEPSLGVETCLSIWLNANGRFYWNDVAETGPWSNCDIMGLICEWESASDIQIPEYELWDGRSISRVSPDSNNVYHIHTASELKYIQSLVNPSFSFEGFTVRLEDDIYLNGKEWVPIGSSALSFDGEPDRCFSGSFDGNNHTVYGLKCVGANTSKTNSPTGLFSYVKCTSDCFFKDVTIEGSVSGNGEHGGLIGNMQIEEGVEVVIDNVVTKTSVSDNGDGLIGGLIGALTVQDNASIYITNCRQLGRLSSGLIVVGGFIGTVTATKTSNIGFYRCLQKSVLRDVGSWGYRSGTAGGLIGSASNGNYEIKECAVDGEIWFKGYGQECGGLIGKITPHSITIEDCEMFAYVHTEHSKGNSGMSFVMSGCYDDNYDEDSEWTVRNIFISSVCHGNSYGGHAPCCGLIVLNYYGGDALKNFSVYNCYFDKGKTNASNAFLYWVGLLQSGTSTNNVYNSAIYSSNKLKTDHTLYNTWDTGNVWEYASSGYPVLRAFDIEPCANHNYTVSVTAATCTDTGTKVYTCANCKYMYSETIPTGDHTWDDGVITTPPTEDAPGTKTFTCLVCGTQRTENVTLESLYQYPANYNPQTDHWHFGNQTTPIPLIMYQKAFGLIKGSWLYWSYGKDNHGEKGSCYGMAASTGVFLKNYINIGSVLWDPESAPGEYAQGMMSCWNGSSGLHDSYIVPIKMDLSQLIMYGYLLQESSDMSKQIKQNNNDLDGLFAAAQSYVAGNGEPVVVGIYGEEDGKESKHALYVCGIGVNNSDYTEILVDDSNYHGAIEVPRKLFLRKTNGSYSGWDYVENEKHNVQWGSGKKYAQINYSFPSSLLYFVGVEASKSVADESDGIMNSDSNLVIVDGDADGLLIDQNDLYPIEVMNGAPVDETNAYWLEPGINTIDYRSEADGSSLMFANDQYAVEIDLNAGSSATTTVSEYDYDVDVNVKKNEVVTIRVFTKVESNSEYSYTITGTADNDAVHLSGDEKTATISGLNVLTLTLDNDGQVNSVDAAVEDGREVNVFISESENTVTTDFVPDESEEPSEPEQPDEPIVDEPDEPAGEGLCKWCGEPHTGFWGHIVAFFHRIIYFFAHLFSLR